MLLAIDPGQAKCGWALLDSDGRVVARGIWTRSAVRESMARLAAEWPLDLIVMGNRTGHRGLLQEFADCPEWRNRTRLVEEDRSSEEARQRYVRATTRGWRRLIPASLRYPSGPYDDYVAVILAERYLRAAGTPRPCGAAPESPGGSPD